MTSGMGTQMPISHLQLPPDCSSAAIPSNSNKTHSELVVHDLGSCSAAAEIVAAIQIILNPAVKSMHAAAAVTENITTAATRRVQVGASGASS